MKGAKEMEKDKEKNNIVQVSKERKKYIRKQKIYYRFIKKIWNL